MSWQNTPALSRRAALGLIGAVGGGVGLAGTARAAFPDHDVRMIVGFSAGGAVDLVARLLSDPLRAALGQTVVVDNRPGASGLIAADAVARSPADGHTVYVSAMSAYAVLPQVPGQPMPLNMERDLVPIANVAGVINALVVSPKSPFKSVPELIAAAKAKPGGLSYASTGNGTSQHLAAELFSRLAGIEMTHIPYRGGSNAIVDIIAGRVDMTFGNFPEFIGQIREGSLRLLAFGGTRASPLFPNTPLVRDTVPGFEVTNWIGLAGPAAMPAPAVAAWDAAVAKVVASEEFRAKVTDAGMEVLGQDQAAFKATIANDRRRWGDVIKQAGLKAD